MNWILHSRVKKHLGGEYMFPTLRRSAIYFLILIAVALQSSAIQAGVAVLANNCDVPVHFSIINPDGKQQQYMLDRTDVVPIPVTDKVAVVFRIGRETAAIFASGQHHSLFHIGR